MRVTGVLYRLQSMKLSLVPFMLVVTKQEAGQLFNPPDAVEGTHDYLINPVYSLGRHRQ